MTTILRNDNDRPFNYNRNKGIEIERDIDKILSILDNNTLSYAKSAMISSEIKANNLIEGLRDDLTYIEEVIKTKQFEPRIINIYNGYRYILKHQVINKESLKELYSILSANLLEDDDLSRMGDYYRNGNVYVYTSAITTKAPEITPEPEKAPFLMEQLYDYINQDDETTIIDKYIKSQIIHFYFVYVHPYFDVNGRTGRTLAMWYLLNTKAYSFIIFNRGINFNKAKYYEVIRNSIKYNNLDRFIKYMLSNVKDELIKEVAIKDITKNIKLSSLEIQTINYLLSMKDGLTTKDFYYFYNRFNDKTSIDTLKETILNPLEKKGIIILGDYSKNNPFNQKFSINEELIPTYLELKRND